MNRGRTVVTVLAVPLAAFLLACPEDDRNANNPVDHGPPPARAETINRSHVDDLCDYVKAFVDSPEARGNVGVKAEMSGIPKELKNKAKAFSVDPSAANQALVAWACAQAGDN